MRKPIQVTALRFETAIENNKSGLASIDTELIALCDDGTIWTMLGIGNEWVPVAKIPQGPILAEWLLEVEAMLDQRGIKDEVITQIVEENYDTLLQQFNQGYTQGQAAQSLIELIR